MIATLISLFTVLKPILAPFLTFIVGWLFPSPIQKAINDQAKVHDAERKASDGTGATSDLDHLP